MSNIEYQSQIEKYGNSVAQNARFLNEEKKPILFMLGTRKIKAAKYCTNAITFESIGEMDVNLGIKVLIQANNTPAVVEDQT
ncbi:hypothetical protein F388_00601 [Mannheimia haemolytica serotype 6 str. H23]|nr:hypothetical protein F388_00601 [Mannheimia haemolytica serotype 6 str. H23]